MIRVVIDTNTLVSAVISPNGPNARIFDLIINEEIRPYLTEAVLDEYSRVFNYERLQHLNKKRIARLLSLMARISVIVKPVGRLKISAHEEDNRIYECAVAAKARYIVTENTKHFPIPHKITKIVNASQLLRILNRE